MFTVYMATNQVNGKSYIGFTGKGLPDRQKAHLKNARLGRHGRFYEAIRKHGPDKFTWTTLAQFSSYDEAIEGEINFIAERRPRYNMTKGGDGIPGFVWTDEMRQRKGRTMKSLWTDERKKVHAELMRQSWTPERRQRHGDALRGRVASDETKAALRKANRQTGRRSVMCLENGIVFESILSAARSVGASAGSVLSTSMGKQRASLGLHFIFSPGKEMSREDRRLMISAIDENAVQQRKRGRTKKIPTPAVNGRDRLGRSAAGPMARAKKIICLNDQKPFESARAAAHHYGIDNSVISAICRGKRKTASGKCFAYAGVV